MPGTLINVFTIGIVWWFLTAGNVLQDARFFEWAGAHPSQHRLLFSAGLALYAAFLIAARKFLPPEKRGKAWVFLWWNRWGEGRGFTAAVVIACLAAASIALAAVARHASFNAGFDLAIFDQAVWNTLHGKFLWSSIKGHICVLGDHFSPILLLYVPGMALWEDTRALLVLQALVFGINALLVHALCRQRWEKSAWNWIFPLAYCLYLPARNAAQFDFHPEILADTFVFVFFWALFSGRRAALLLALMGLVLCKETFWALAFFLGVFLALFGRRFWNGPAFPLRLLGISLAVISPPAFWAETHWLIPFLSGKPYPYTGNYTAGGLLPLLAAGFSRDSLFYLIKLFGPLGFASLLCPALLLPAAFGLLQNLFSVNPATHSIYFQYTLGLTSIVFTAAIRGVPSAWRWQAYVLVCAILFSGVPDAYRAQVYARQGREPVRIAARAALRQIPSDAIVKTNEFFAAHLAHRPYLYIPDDGGFWPFELAASHGREKYALMAEGVGSGFSPGNIDFLKDHGYTIIHAADGVCLMRQKP